MDYEDKLFEVFASKMKCFGWVKTTENDPENGIRKNINGTATQELINLGVEAEKFGMMYVPTFGLLAIYPPKEDDYTILSEISPTELRLIADYRESLSYLVHLDSSYKSQGELILGQFEKKTGYINKKEKGD